MKEAFLYERVLEGISQVIIGFKEEIKLLLATLLAGGHAILVGYPGTAKTLIVKTIAEVLGASFSRIQFVPDLLPTDITGSYVLHGNEFVFRKGPLFADIVLADEINRASPRTQSALLEAMQERQVTVWGKTHHLPELFTVIATMNPVETEGVYPLSEAQLDRFTTQITLSYPSPAELLSIMDVHGGGHEPRATRVLTREKLLEERKKAKSVHASPNIKKYIVNIVNTINESQFLKFPVSPRAALSLLLVSKSKAYIEGRDYVTPEDVKQVALSVLLHRIHLTTEAELQSIEAADLVNEALERTRPP